MSNINHSPSNSLITPRSRSSWPTTTSAFFASPFSSNSSRPPSSPSIAAGFLFDKSIAEEPEPEVPIEVPFKLQSNFNLRPIPASVYHQRPQDFADQPDRLDRLLAEFDAQTLSISSASTSKTSLESIEVQHSSEEEHASSIETDLEDEAWESSLVSMSINQSKRLSCDCVNCGLILGFEIGTSSEGCASASTSGGSGEDSWTTPVRVRFCEGAVEEILTW
ncbi:uncharacterized protein MELLADRAFT_79876 [Melampsora larici-populina 98AG31]|nr:uncharacterized protein MELLADRAFT_79876 [Melampsora larici-populina 98AG31]EGF96952.1 hypothetical protein MELLADRAFT_79876 [Melampsora larici-populina 98AG31]